MTVTEQAYLSVLEQKLVEAERALYGFRKIYEHWRVNGFGDVGSNQDPGEQSQTSRTNWEEEPCEE